MSQTTPCGCPCEPGENIVNLPIKNLHMGCPGMFVDVDVSGLPGMGGTTPPVESPETLKADLDLYVSPSGDDANNGLTPETPFKTINAALNKTKLYSRNGCLITIHLAGGTYTEDVAVNFGIHYSRLAIKGDDSMPQINGAVRAESNGHLVLDGLNIRQKTATYSIHTSTFARVDVHDCIVANGTPGGYIADAQAHGMLNIQGSLHAEATATLSGMFLVSASSLMTFASGSSTVCSGAVTSGTLVVMDLGRLSYGVSPVATITGSVTGPCYNVSRNAVVRVPATIPGTTAGVVATGGQYIVG